MTVEGTRRHPVTRGGEITRWSAFLLAWALTAVLGLIDLMAIRQCAIVVFTVLNVSPAALGLADKVLLLLMVLGWLSAVVYAQHAYSDATGKAAGWRPLLVTRFRRVTMIQLLILAGAVGIPLGLVGAAQLR